MVILHRNFFLILYSSQLQTSKILDLISTISQFVALILPFFFIHDLKKSRFPNFLCLSSRSNNFQHPSGQARQRASQRDEIICSIHPGNPGRKPRNLRWVLIDWSLKKCSFSETSETSKKCGDKKRPNQCSYSARAFVLNKISKLTNLKKKQWSL